MEFEIGRVYKDEKWCCIQAVKDLYKANDISTFLDDKTPEQWIQTCEAGFPGYAEQAHIEPGNLLVFKLNGRRWHVGVYLGGGRFFHTHGDRTASGRLTRFLDSFKGAFNVQSR